MEDEAESWLGRNIGPLLTGAVAGAVVAFLAFAVYARVWGGQLKANGMQYQDLITVVLTAVAVLITIFGVVVAILAIWGYATFKEIAKKTAKTYVKKDIKSGALRSYIEVIAVEFMKKECGESGMLRTALLEEARRLSFVGAEPKDNAVPFAYDAGGDESNEDE